MKLQKGTLEPEQKLSAPQKKFQKLCQKIEQEQLRLIGMYFYDVPPGKEAEAASYGIKQTKNGKFALKAYDKSGRTFSFNKQMADKIFGPNKYWKPNNEAVSEDIDEM